MDEVKGKLSAHLKVMEAMPEDERAVFKGCMTLILDLLDEMDKEGDAEDAAPPAPPRPAAESLSTESAKATLSKAGIRGREVMEIFRQVSRLENQGKMVEAAALRKTVPTGKALGERALNKWALELEQHIFTTSGGRDITALLDRALRRPILRQVLSSPVPPFAPFAQAALFSCISGITRRHPGPPTRPGR